MATIDQIHEMFFRNKSTRYTRRILMEMHEDMLLFRDYPRAFSGSSKGIYMLDVLGRYMIAAEREMESVTEVKWDERDNTIMPERRMHVLGITNIYVELHKKIHKRKLNSVVFIETFLGERQVGRMKYQIKDAYGEMQDREINPDAYMELVVKENNKKRINMYFFEYDTGKENKKKIEEKIQNYVEFYSSKERLQYYPVEPIVIIISQSILALRKFETAIRENIGLEKIREANKSARQSQNNLDGQRIVNLHFFGATEEEFLDDPLGNIYYNMENKEKKISLIK
jgi:hypothetical protein